MMLTFSHICNWNKLIEGFVAKFPDDTKIGGGAGCEEKTGSARFGQVGRVS